MATNRPNRVQAKFIMRVSDSAGELPGLWSVATAIGTPAAAQAQQAEGQHQHQVAQRAQRAGQPALAVGAVGAGFGG